MPVPKEWPTREQIRRVREEISYRDNPGAYLRVTDAAEWAVRVRPQLEALVAGWNNYENTGHFTPHGEVWDITRKACAKELARLIATPHEEHEETQG